jgi:hypothetical protein
MRSKAFIIGMTNYIDSQNILQNCVNDANMIYDVFTQLGIDSTKINNIGIAELTNAFEQFIQELINYEVAIVFFAGHGLEIGGENFLCAIDTDFSSLNHIRYSALPLNYMIDELQKTKIYTKIIILDACRDNPFIRGLRGSNRLELAPVSAPLGSLIAFSTSPGQSASDGGNIKNGAYTYSLLQHILVKDLKIEELFKRVRNTLFSLTNKAQISWEHTSLMSDFYFSSSQLVGSFNSNYSNVALADGTFDYSKNNAITNIINALHSCNWNLQNPAAYQINKIDTSNCDIDEIFVLGRNIYQAGIGPGFEVYSYLTNLSLNIKYFPAEARFHLLNGIVYEIYFNNQGVLRDEFKSARIDIVYSLLSEESNKDSLLFIDSKLRNYDFRILYKPVSSDNISLNIIYEQYEESLYRIIKIDMDGVNILYNNEGTGIWEPNDSLILCTKEELQKIIIKKIGVPSYKLSIFYLNLPEEKTDFCIPRHFNLYNRSIHD